MPTSAAPGFSIERSLEIAHQCMSWALQFDYLSTGAGRCQSTAPTAPRNGGSAAAHRAGNGTELRDIARQYLAEIARRCGFGGTSQLSRAFRARFGMPPRQYLALVRQQDVDWLAARMVGDGDQDAFKLWRQRGLSKSPADGTWHAPVRAPKQRKGAS